MRTGELLTELRAIMSADPATASRPHREPLVIIADALESIVLANSAAELRIRQEMAVQFEEIRARLTRLEDRVAALEERIA